MCATTPPDMQQREERCACGNLLAKLTPSGIEIRCRRCKRLHMVPWADVQWEAPVTPR